MCINCFYCISCSEILNNSEFDVEIEKLTGYAVLESASNNCLECSNELCLRCFLLYIKKYPSEYTIEKDEINKTIVDIIINNCFSCRKEKLFL